jgi:hypothetical protein
LNVVNIKKIDVQQISKILQEFSVIPVRLRVPDRKENVAPPAKALPLL